jgi:hypothetical protein
MDLAETLRGYLGKFSAPPPDDLATPLRPMLDPAARTRSVMGSPETQTKVDETLRDIVRSAAEPFQQVGRAISGRSDNPVPEGMLGALGVATAIPGGMAKGALKAGAKAGGEALEDILKPAAKSATGGIGDMIKAYHGSPHDFERFDLSKIGTGEGAQAYGHGLYFAENEGVAKDYRDHVKDTAMLARNNQRMSELAREMDKYKKHGTMRDFSDPRGYEAAAEYDRLMDEKMKPGRMYEVGIRANPEHFLDWDKPLSEQHPAAAEKLKTVVRPDPDRTVGDWIKHSPGAEQRLREAGIPGIKYLDQGSRGKGDGTRNYVVFDDKLIDILKKYGIAGIGALPAMNAYHYQDKP